jgi:hypothetical protein
MLKKGQGVVDGAEGSRGSRGSVGAGVASALRPPVGGALRGAIFGHVLAVARAADVEADGVHREAIKDRGREPPWPHGRAFGR